MASDLTPLFKAALNEELEQLREAVHQVAEPLSEQQLWSRPLQPGNSIGHLVLHLTGNLSHYVGAQLGKTGYVRDREREFTETQPPSKAVLLANLDAAVATFRRVVEDLNTDEFAAPYPDRRFATVLKALLHFVTHFALHRGQMSYIARLVNPPK